MNICFVDTETTDTDKERSGLIQLAGAIAIEGKIVERFNLTAAPFDDDLIAEEALQVNGLTKGIIRGYQEPRRAYLIFIKMLGQYVDKYNPRDKFQLCGFNGDFDADMIRSWFKKNGDDYFGSWFWWPVIDVAKLAGIRYMDTRGQLPNFRLTTVAKFAGLEVDQAKAHDAMYDIDLTMRLFEMFTRDLTNLDFKLEFA